MDSNKFYDIGYLEEKIASIETENGINIIYNGKTIGSVDSGDIAILDCHGKIMNSDVVIGDTTIVCSNKVMETDLSIDMGEILPYLCFKTYHPNTTIELEKIGNPNPISLETSFDGEIWTNFIPNETVITLPRMVSRVYFRGDNNTFSTDSENYYHFVCSNDVYVSGNIMTLLDKTGNLLTLNTSFANLFRGNNHILSVPELPATTVGDFAYYQMFRECSKIVKSPELPATEIGAHCYQNMFWNSSLRESPMLPAMTMKAYCYAGMFYGTFIKKIPLLPATILATGCYHSMFCHLSMSSTIRQPPVLSATIMEPYCYSHMFDDTLLSYPPELPATTLAEGCYSYMFYSSHLSEAPVLPATNLEPYCYSYMLAYSYFTEAPVLPATIIKPYCYEGLFFGTYITQPPVLSATIMEPYCYSHMFERSKIEYLPNLSAETLAEGCYSYMFQSVGSRTKPVIIASVSLPILVMEPFCYAYMFSNSYITYTKLSPDDYGSYYPSLPADVLAESCYEGMFRNMILTPTGSSAPMAYTPELKAKKMAKNCYKYMFANISTISGWNSLNYVRTQLDSVELAEGCYYGMFMSEQSAVYFDLPAIKLYKDCYSYMFNGVRITDYSGDAEIYLGYTGEISLDYFDHFWPTVSQIYPGFLFYNGDDDQSSNIPTNWIVRRYTPEKSCITPVIEINNNILSTEAQFSYVDDYYEIKDNEEIIGYIDYNNNWHPTNQGGNEL